MVKPATLFIGAMLAPRQLTIRATRKSRHRTAILLALEARREAYASQLATACGVRVDVVLDVMNGNHPKYAPGRSLMSLGLAASRVTVEGTVYELTGLGRLELRLLREAGCIPHPLTDVRTHVPPDIRPDVAPAPLTPPALP